MVTPPESGRARRALLALLYAGSDPAIEAALRLPYTTSEGGGEGLPQNLA